MLILSIYRGARISAFKCRDVSHAIQGLPAAVAVDLLNATPKKAARLILKTLKSAIANAENNNNIRPETLIVQEAVVGEGPTMKRFRPKARGSAGPIRKRTSHIRIVLTDDLASLPRRAHAKAKACLTKAEGSARRRTGKKVGRPGKPDAAASSSQEHSTEPNA
jgi:large subunit ribosomal protein L22